VPSRWNCARFSMAAPLVIFALAFAPSAMRRPVATSHAPRSSALSAPMTDLSLADMQKVATLPQVDAPDAVLRLTVSAARVLVGFGRTDGIADTALMAAYTLRSLFTAHTVGAVRMAESLGRLRRTPLEIDDSEGTFLFGVRHASMLMYYPLDFWRWWSRMLPGVVPAAPVVARRIASSLWLLWIICTAIVSVSKLRRQATELERQTLHRRLLKLACDVPVAANFLLAQPVLPLGVIGALGVLSSWQALRIAVQAPAQPRTVLLPASTPHFRERLSEVRRRIPLCSSQECLRRAGSISTCSSWDALPRIQKCSSRDGLSLRGAWP